MCTVSFIPVKDKVFITSNREEKSTRKPADLPEYFVMEHCTMVYPKDADGGGTWINLCSTGNAGVFLNGAFDSHRRMPDYRISRGLVFLEFMDVARPLRQFLKSPLKGVEPFTFILWQNNNLYECRWDEVENKHCRALPAYRPYIWSSATLYDKEARKKNELWFVKWLNANNAPNCNDILGFHRLVAERGRQNNLSISISEKVSTVSITGLELVQERGLMKYFDVIAGQTVERALEFSNKTVGG